VACCGLFLSPVKSHGTIALIILYEIENIRRFESMQDFASYSRLGDCYRASGPDGIAFSRWEYSFIY
jgi:hypothetical protein